MATIEEIVERIKKKLNEIPKEIKTKVFTAGGARQSLIERGTGR